MKTMKLVVSGSAVILGSLLLAGSALAAEQERGGPREGGRPPVMGMMKRDGHASSTQRGVGGIVTSLSGTTLTLSAATRKIGSDKTVSTTTYTVDASNATVFRNNATTTLSTITIGEMIVAEGTVNGTGVIATKIRAGLTLRAEEMREKMMDKRGKNASSTPFVGNGQPIIGGSVTIVSGNSITVSSKGGVTYTVDASSAKITKHGVTGATISNVVVGDMVVVQGAVNGSSVTASTVVDQGAPKVKNNESGDDKGKGEHRGFMGAVGGFFSRVFGF